MTLNRSLAFGLPLVALLGAAPSRDLLPPIGYHDNTVASGIDRDGVREVTFEIRRGLMLPQWSRPPGHADDGIRRAGKAAATTRTDDPGRRGYPTRHHGAQRER